jgi:hypothetical protein
MLKQDKIIGAAAAAGDRRVTTGFARYTSPYQKMGLLRLSFLRRDIHKFSFRCETTWRNIDHVLMRIKLKEIMCNYPPTYSSSAS